MRYATANAFRAALEIRLNRTAANDTRVQLSNLRRMVVYERFLARLLVVAPDRWVLKGAVALDFRFGNDARPTRDLDIGRTMGPNDSEGDLVAASALDLGDYFEFKVTKASQIKDEQEEVASRYSIAARLDKRRFEIVTMDVGLGGPPVDLPDYLTSPPMLSFAGIEPVAIPTLHLNQHVAEKLQAYVRIFSDGRRNTRVKDLVDLLIISGRASFESDRLKAALEATFAQRAVVDLPQSFPDPPDDWEVGFAVMAAEVGLDPDIVAAHQSVSAFLSPVLDGSNVDSSKWDPALRAWTI